MQSEHTLRRKCVGLGQAFEHIWSSPDPFNNRAKRVGQIQAMSLKPMRVQINPTWDGLKSREAAQRAPLISYRDIKYIQKKAGSPPGCNGSDKVEREPNLKAKRVNHF